MRNISVIYFEFGLVVQESHLKYFLSRVLLAILVGGANTFSQF